MAGYLITSLLSLITNLLPSITASAQAPSSSSSNSNNTERGCARAVEEDLERLKVTLKGIKATLLDAEERDIRDHYVKHWLKELKKVAYNAEDVLNEYRYEVSRVQLEARKASEASGSQKRKKIEYIVPIPDGMVDRLKKIRSQFDEIVKDREDLQLRESDGMRRPNNKILRHPMGHMVDEANIFGRDAEIEEVINFLLSEKEKPFSVISIIGKGGLGKTTIAQLVYKDERLTRCFDLFGWVCVSEEFDVGRLTKAIIETVTKINDGLSELSSLQEKLAKTVMGKRIVLVLDDVWNENQSLWELLRVPFKEAKLVRILMTTRNTKVADVMQTTIYFRPTNLPEDSCWQLFQHYAFRGTSDTMPPHLVKVGREIMRKCGGLPLAVKSIASLLRHETYEECWREILESDLWESNPSNDIFSALHISYAHLPSYLKPCFLFCSMYRKKYILKKINLIELWISHGYIQSGGKRKIIEIGVDYYEELKQRSLLDDISDPFSECCILHDMIHDLARLNSEYEHYSVEINSPLDIQENNILREVYHLYARGSIGYVNQILQQNLKGLRTLSVDLSYCSRYLGHQYNWQSNFTKFEALRVLELNGDFTVIPDFIPELRHLTCLSITSCIKTLPLSMGLLYNLQTLILVCYYLEYLPEIIGDLANLQFVNIQSYHIKKLPKSLCSLSNLLRLVIRCNNLEEVPLDLRNLCKLHKLTFFTQQTLALPSTIGCLSSLEELNFPAHGDTVKEFIDYRPKINYLLDYVPHSVVNFPAIKKMTAELRVRNIAWLKDMKALEGRLSIEGLEVSNLVDAQHANLRNKCKLEALDLCWDYDPDYHLPSVWKPDMRLRLKLHACEDGLVGANDSDFSLLECLQPHPNLKKLRIKMYRAATVPGWMRDPFSMQSIQQISLENCDNIQSLPFGRSLHTLKHLTIGHCFSIRVLQLELLPSRLVELHIVCCIQLESITGLGNLHILDVVEISHCTFLKSLMMDELQLVKSTEAFGDFSHEVPHISRQSNSSLTTFIVENCCTLSVLPFSNFHTLKNLQINSCGSIQVLQLEQQSSQLEKFQIHGCNNLESITGLGNLNMLAELEISNCSSLKSLLMDELQLVEKPYIGRQSISSLKRLEISNCELLRALPDGLIPSEPSCYVRVEGCGCPNQFTWTSTINQIRYGTFWSPHTDPR